MNPPHSSAVVDVRDEDVDRYREAGWTEAKADSAKPAKKSAAKKSAK
jgi:hypothetical protein